MNIVLAHFSIVPKKQGNQTRISVGKNALSRKWFAIGKILSCCWNYMETCFQVFWDLVISVILLQHFSRSGSPFWQLMAYLIGEIWWFLANELDCMYILQFSKKFCFVWFTHTFLWEAGELNVHFPVEAAFAVAWIYVRRSVWCWNQWQCGKMTSNKNQSGRPIKLQPVICKVFEIH